MFCEHCDKEQYAKEIEEMKKLIKENFKLMSVVQPEEKNKLLEDMLAI